MKTFRILVASGGFKDVFLPDKTCRLVSNFTREILANKVDLEMKIISMADGGEYSLEVLSEIPNSKIIREENIIHPTGKAVSAGYLKFNDSIFIGASEILRLTPEETNSKDPMALTSYGLGQLIDRCLRERPKTIYLGLGGTSTVDAGLGALQALGAKFFDTSGDLVKPTNSKYFTGCDIDKIFKIELRQFDQTIVALGDAKIPISLMDTPIRQKFSSKIDLDRKVSHLLTGLIDLAKRLGINKEEPFFGVAGGIPIGLKNFFHLEFQAGVDFFSQQKKVLEELDNAQLLITCEGKFDNSLLGKTGIGLSNMAKKKNVPVLYIAGTVANALQPHFAGCHSNKNLPSDLKNCGIDWMISFFSMFKEAEALNEIERIRLFKEKTPSHLKNALREYFESRWNL